MEMLQSCGESLFNEDGSVNIVDNKALKPILEIYSQMVKDGTLVEVTDWDQYIASINNGTTAGVINGCWIMASITANDDQSGKWALTNMPKLDGIDGATNYSNNGGSSWAISSNCKKTDLAIDFMKSTFAGSTALYDDIIAKALWQPGHRQEIPKHMHSQLHSSAMIRFMQKSLISQPRLHPTSLEHSTTMHAMLSEPHFPISSRQEQIWTANSRLHRKP